MAPIRMSIGPMTWLRHLFLIGHEAAGIPEGEPKAGYAKVMTGERQGALGGDARIGGAAGESPLGVALNLNCGKIAGIGLPVIARASRAVPAASPAGAEFGLYREDVFVVMPAIFLFVPATFGADFAAHRSGFDFTKGPMTAPAYLGGIRHNDN